MKILNLVRKHGDARKVARAIKRDPAAWAEVLEHDEVLVPMIDELVRRQRHVARQRASGARSGAGDTPELRESRRRGAERRDASFRASILDWPLFGGKVLRDATRDDLLESAAKRRDMVEAHATRAAFEEAVAARMPARGKVGEHLGPDALSALYDDSVA